jgi:hypothetical protein
MMRPVGWTLLTSAAVLLALGIWDLPFPEGPALPEAQGLLGSGSAWYFQAAYLAVGVVLALAGGWMLYRADDRDGDGSG